MRFSSETVTEGVDNRSDDRQNAITISWVHGTDIVILSRSEGNSWKMAILVIGSRESRGTIVASIEIG